MSTKVTKASFRGIAAAAIATVLALGAGCGTQESGSSGSGGNGHDYVFSIANATEAGALEVDLHKGMDQAAKTAGIKLHWFNNNFDGPTALNNARIMVQGKPDAIMEFNGVEGVADPIGKLFQDAKIPCIAINIPVSGCPLFNLSNKNIGIDTAKAVAPLAKAKGYDAANTTVVFVQVSSAGTENNDCVRYFYTTLAQQLGLKEVQPADITTKTVRIGSNGLQLDSDSTLESAYTATKNALQALPKDRNLILYGTSDDEVIGAYRAVSESGHTGNVMVAGLGSTEKTRDLLRKDPNWVAEGEIFFGQWGEYLLAMGVAAKQGVDLPDLTPSPQVVLTKKNLGDYFAPGAKAPKQLPTLSAGQQYLSKTGVLQKVGNIQGLK